jgi:hypothetical protein
VRQPVVQRNMAGRQRIPVSQHYPACDYCEPNFAIASGLFIVVSIREM